MVFAQDAKWLLPLHQCEKVISHGLAIEEVVHAQQEVPVGTDSWRKCTHLLALWQQANHTVHSICLQKNL